MVLTKLTKLKRDLFFRSHLCYNLFMTSKIASPLTFTVQFFREGKLFVAYNPELDVSSCGATLGEAKKNIRDAISGFLKSATKKGTLDEILEEAVLSLIAKRAII